MAAPAWNPTREPARAPESAVYWSRRTAEGVHRDELTVPCERAITELEIGDAGTSARSGR
jgi:hypothetical protein